MRTHITALAAAVCLSAALVLADDLTVDYDPLADFSSFKTFALRQGKVESPRPELDNPLFVKKLGAAIRSALMAKGLKETADRPDLMVDYSITGEDFSLAVRRPDVVIPSSPGRRGMRIASAGPEPRRFTEGTLVIDLMTSGLATPVWRGVYRDDESTGSKLVQKLPADAKELVSHYPPKSRQ